MTSRDLPASYGVTAESVSRQIRFMDAHCIARGSRRRDECWRGCAVQVRVTFDIPEPAIVTFRYVCGLVPPGQARGSAGGAGLRGHGCRECGAPAPDEARAPPPAPLAKRRLPQGCASRGRLRPAVRPGLCVLHGRLPFHALPPRGG